MRDDYRWELWINAARVHAAQEALWTFDEAYFLRGPDIPATDSAPARAVLILDARANRKGVRELDQFVTRLAERHEGHAWRTAAKTLLVSQMIGPG
jgi:hypothetical protein